MRKVHELLLDADYALMQARRALDTKQPQTLDEVRKALNHTSCANAALQAVEQVLLGLTPKEGD